MSPPVSIRLLDVRAFPPVAAQSGIAESARALIGAGRLIPLQIGYGTYYRWADLIEVIPERARSRYAALALSPPASGPHRTGLTGHTVTVEHATRLTALRMRVEPGALIVVERVDGHLSLPVAIPARQIPVAYAQVHASSCGARYVDGGAR